MISTNPSVKTLRIAIEIEDLVYVCATEVEILGPACDKKNKNKRLVL